MRWRGCVLVLVCGVIGATTADAAETLIVGSKKFTENVILGEIVSGVALLSGGDAGAEVLIRAELGGTRVLFAALESGQIDAYVEYTGTLLHEVFAGDGLEDDSELAAVLAGRGLRMSGRLGFNNTYGLGVTRATAEKYGLDSMSDLVSQPQLRFGLTNEFVSRADGWDALREAYGLPQSSVNGMDHDLAYRGLVSGSVDVVDVYTTDAEIAEFDLVVLEDDLGHFPVYEAVVLYRADVAVRMPMVAAAIEGLAGRIDAAAMIEMNRLVKVGGATEESVAGRFVADVLGSGEDAAVVRRVSFDIGRVWVRTREHVVLVGVSMVGAILVSIPLGVAAFRVKRLGWVVLGGTGVIQTVPALALLVLMIPMFGIGRWPAIAALFLYSLLPIVRNTHAGLVSIPRELAESAEALGLGWWTRLLRVDLPLASRSIVAGVKTSLVLNIGFATLGALIGAGGYGQPILQGIRLADTGLILEGAIPAALMALGAQWVLGLAERAVVPRGLRLEMEAG